ncbi:MAG: RNA polymerase sigma factor [Terriglobales bacterium]
MDEKKLLAILERLLASREDADAWNDLYHIMWPYLFSIMYRHLGANRFLAEESAQEIMLRIFRHADFGTATSSRFAFLGYVRTLCHSLTVEMLRRKGKPSGAIDQDDIGFEIPDWRPSPEENALSKERFRQYLEGLSASDRLLIRHILDGQNAVEIAQQEKIALKTARNRISLLRKDLRKHLFRQASESKQKT